MHCSVFGVTKLTMDIERELILKHFVLFKNVKFKNDKRKQ